MAIPAVIPTTRETVAAYQICFFHRTVSGRVIIAGHVIRQYYQDRRKPGMQQSLWYPLIPIVCLAGFGGWCRPLHSAVLARCQSVLTMSKDFAYRQAMATHYPECSLTYQSSCERCSSQHIVAQNSCFSRDHNSPRQNAGEQRWGGMMASLFR